MDLIKRRTYLGGTDIAVICGLSPYKTPYELWQEKTSTEPPVDFDNDFMAIGRAAEGMTANMYAERNNYGIIMPPDEPIRHPVHPYLACNYDRLLYRLEDGPTGVKKLGEVKTTVRSVYKGWNGVVPDTYWCQIQHYLGILDLVMGIDKAVFIILVLDQRQIFDFEVDIDRTYIKQLWDYATWWWETHVIGGKSPDYTDKEWDATAHRPGSSVLADQQAVEDCFALKKVRHQIKELSVTKELLEARIKTYIQHSERLITPADSSVLATYVRQSRREVDTKRFKKDYPDLFEAYAKTSDFRVLRVKGDD